MMNFILSLSSYGVLKCGLHETTTSKWLKGAPPLPVKDIDHHPYAEVYGMFHLVLHDLPHLLEVILGQLDHQLVVNLEGKVRRSQALLGIWASLVSNMLVRL